MNAKRSYKRQRPSSRGRAPLPISFLVPLLAACLLPLAVAAGAPLSGGAISQAAESNPHAGMACGDCHATVPEKGKWTPKEVLAALKKDPVESCRECHKTTEINHHPIVKKTERMLPEGLPLSAAGEVICSTCHDIHMVQAIDALLRGYDTGRYRVRMDMCLDCHGETFGAMNPHQAEAGSEKCYTCHTARPGAGDNIATVALREELGKVCNFCHNVQAKSHPMNVDPMRKLPESLPRGRGGEIMCGTCHDPHGTEETLHFLSRKYVEFLEAGRYANPHGRNDYASCLGCHLEMAPRDEAMRKNLRYQGDDLPICLSCHGGMDSCHPILVNLGPGMDPKREMALSPEGKIKCVTCHDPTPKGSSGVGMRGRAPGQPINAICFRCHDKGDLGSRNPHLSMSDRGSCRFCHDTMTDPTNEEAVRVSFISNTRLICLRCHAQDNHPGGVDHMVSPRKVVVPEAFRLSDKGRITCTTCHNPHIETKDKDGDAGRRRFVVADEGMQICTRCHRR